MLSYDHGLEFLFSLRLLLFSLSLSDDFPKRTASLGLLTSYMHELAATGTDDLTGAEELEWPASQRQAGGTMSRRPLHKDLSASSSSQQRCSGQSVLGELPVPSIQQGPLSSLHDLSYMDANFNSSTDTPRNPPP